MTATLPETTATRPQSPTPAATARVEILVDGAWAPVCDAELLRAGRGVAVLLPDGRQAAVFTDRRGRVHAVGNRDPFTGAFVLSRGLTGSVDGHVYVASPLLKQRFDLETGVCLDDVSVRIPAYTARFAQRPHPRG